MWCLWGRWESQARHWPCSQWDPFPSPGLSWVSVAHAWYWWHSLSTFLVLIDLFMLILFQRKWSRFFQSQAEVEAGSEADSGWLACCCCSAVKSCLTLCDPMDCSPPGSSVHEIFQARVLEWGAIAFSSTTVGKHQFFGTQPSSWCISYLVLCYILIQMYQFIKTPHGY